MQRSLSKIASNRFPPTLTIVMVFVGQSFMHSLQPTQFSEMNAILPRKRGGIFTCSCG